MGAFEYSALDADGRERRGVLEGDGPRQDLGEPVAVRTGLVHEPPPRRERVQEGVDEHRGQDEQGGGEGDPRAQGHGVAPRARGTDPQQQG